MEENVDRVNAIAAVDASVTRVCSHYLVRRTKAGPFGIRTSLLRRARTIYSTRRWTKKEVPFIASSFFVAPFATPSSFAWSFHIASLVIASLD
jgi:hypothetical protein